MVRTYAVNPSIQSTLVFGVDIRRRPPRLASPTQPPSPLKADPHINANGLNSSKDSGVEDGPGPSLARLAWQESGGSRSSTEDFVTLSASLRRKRWASRAMSADELPPWLKGNPQPQDGRRRFTQSRQKSLPLGLDYGNPSTSAGALDPFANAMQHKSAFDYKTGYDAFDFNYTPIIFGSTPHIGQAKAGHSANLANSRQRLQSQRNVAANDEDNYDPFGKGGGGAPLRDSKGNVVTDRRRMQKIAGSGQLADTNFTHDYKFRGAPSPAFGQPASGQPPPGLSDKQRHQWELQQQIDANKAIKAAQAAREKEADDRENQRIQRDLEKMKREAAEEEAKRKAKAQAKLDAVEQRNNIQQVPNQRRLGGGGANLAQSQPDDGLEWWERKGPSSNRRGGAASAFSPTVAGPNATGFSQSANGGGGIYDRIGTTADPLSRSANYSGLFEDPPPRTPLRSSSSLFGDGDGVQTLDNRRRRDSPPRSAKPRSAAVRNEGVMRQLSAMRERLNKEQVRVKSALRRKDYGEELFSDDDVGTEFVLEQSGDRRSERSAKPKKSGGGGRHSPFFSDDEAPPRGAPKSRRSRRTSNGSPRLPSSIAPRAGGGDDDDDLAAMIRNSRTTLPTDTGPRQRKKSSRRESSRNKSSGFFSDSDDDDAGLGKSRGRRRSSGGGDDYLKSGNPDKVVNGFLNDL